MKRPRKLQQVGRSAHAGCQCDRERSSALVASAVTRPNRDATSPSRARSLAAAISCLISLVLLPSCSSLVTSTQFKPWSGHDVYLGQGGTKRAVNGIDIWENGEPDRTYKVLGVLEDSTLENTGAAPNTLNVLSVMSAWSLASRDKRLAREAAKHGADAIVFWSGNRAFLGATQYETNFRNEVKVVAIKYLATPGAGRRPSPPPALPGAPSTSRLPAGPVRSRAVANSDCSLPLWTARTPLCPSGETFRPPRGPKCTPRPDRPRPPSP